LRLDKASSDDATICGCWDSAIDTVSGKDLEFPAGTGVCALVVDCPEAGVDICVAEAVSACPELAEEAAKTCVAGALDPPASANF
jgi:hypothetical protein